MSTGNRLLDALPDAEYRRLGLAPEVVTLGFGSLPTVSTGPIGYVYFPDGCLVAQVIQQGSGSSPQIVMLGRSGVLGLPIFLGSPELLLQPTIAVPGRSLRVRSDVFQAAIERSPTLRGLLGRYTLALMFQMAQRAACNAGCNADQRVAHWLLFASDEVGRDHVVVTHERIARLLCVRRATVTRSFQLLEEKGVIRGARGNLTILDRPGLEAYACDCYRDLRDYYSRLGPVSATAQTSPSEPSERGSRPIRTACAR